MVRWRSISAAFISSSLLLAVLTACSDPCFLSKADAPNCRAAQGGADATLTAIRGAQAYEATSNAVLLSGASTQSAMGLQATSQALAGQATVQAKIISATLTAADVEATQAAIRSRGAQSRSEVAAVGAPILEALFIAAIAAAIVFIVWYSRRGLQSVSRALELRAATLRYGPDNQEVLIVRRLPNGEEQVLNLAQLIGPYLTTDGAAVREVIGALSLPDQFKAYAYLEAMAAQTDRANTHATGQHPTEMVEPPAAAALPAAAANYPYVIETVSGTQQPVEAWLQEAEQRLLAAPQEA